MINFVVVFHAEICWVLKVVTFYVSYRSCLNMNSLHFSGQSESQIFLAVKNQVHLLHFAWFSTILQRKNASKSQILKNSFSLFLMKT